MNTRINKESKVVIESNKQWQPQSATRNPLSAIRNLQSATFATLFTHECSSFLVYNPIDFVLKKTASGGGKKTKPEQRMACKQIVKDKGLTSAKITDNATPPPPRKPPFGWFSLPQPSTL